MSAKNTWPKYRIVPWVDTSPEALNKPNGQIRFGIDVQLEKGGKWKHGHYNGKAVVYHKREDASKAIALLRMKAAEKEMK